MKEEQLLKELISCQKPIKFHTTPARVFILIAHLQLALRYVDRAEMSSIMVQEFINHMIQAIAEVTEIQDLAMVLEAGNHPEFDFKEVVSHSTWFKDHEDQGLAMTKMMEATAAYIITMHNLAERAARDNNSDKATVLGAARREALQELHAMAPIDLVELLDDELNLWEQTVAEAKKSA